MMRRSSFTKRSSFQFIPVWLGLVLVSIVMLIITVVPVGATVMVNTITTGLYHTCRVTTRGTLACWGNNVYGQVSGPNSSSDTFTQVSAGGYHTCGVKTDGTLTCWGRDVSGQVSGPNSSSDTFTQVSGGGYHTCGVRTDGTLACWGNNGFGQVSGPNSSSDTFTQVGGGGYHTCGVKTDGTLACWGYDDYGQMSGPNGSSDTFTQVSGGVYHTCGVKTDGTLACWGHNWYGQVSGPNSSSDTFTQVSGGVYHTCGMKTDGTLACWGYDGYGQVSGPNGSSDTFTQVSGGGYHTCGVKTDSTVACWGHNSYGQAIPYNQPPTDITLSNDNVDENQSLNTEVGTLATTDLDAGDTHTYSLVDTGLCPGPDNGSFNTNADKLRTSAAFDYETKSSYTICVRTDDGNGDIYDEQFTISVNNLNEAPMNMVPGAQSTSINTALTFSAGSGTSISISDVDAGDNLVKVTLTASNGTLTLNGTGGLIFSTGDGTADPTMVFTGTIASINPSLDGISFNPTPGYTGAANVQIVTDDQGNTGAGSPQADDDTVNITVGKNHQVFLPILVRGFVTVPDLVVDSLIATSNAVTVTIRNVGTTAVNDAFWVDVYFDPTETPGVNKQWDAVASHGVVWGVTTSIPAGGTLTLTNDVSDPYYFPGYSSDPPLPVGANVYTLVDSINYSTTYGAVQESNEGNNLFGPVISTASVAGKAPLVGKQSQSTSREGLPLR